MIRFYGLEYRKVPRRFDLGLRVPMVGDYRRIRKDTELPEFHFLPRQAQFVPGDKKAVIPATRRFKGVQFITMSDAWCWRWVDMIHWASDYSITYDEACQVWRKLISEHTAFTDGHSPEAGYRDPITGENEGHPNIQWANLGMIGNIVKVGVNGIECFDMTLPPPPLSDIIAQSWKWHWATEQTPTGVISNFPHIESIIGMPCGVPVPLVSYGGYQAMKDINHFERVKNGARYDIYSAG